MGQDTQLDKAEGKVGTTGRVPSSDPGGHRDAKFPSVAERWAGQLVQSILRMK